MNIKDRNELIRELLVNLKDTDTKVEEVEGHILEDPEHILTVKDEEVKAVKYQRRRSGRSKRKKTVKLVLVRKQCEETRLNNAV